MGYPKGLLDLQGVSLLRRHVDTLRPVCDAISVVLGAHATRLRAVLPAEVSVLVNPEWATTTPSDSLRLALVQAAEPACCLVTPVDVLPARPETLDALLGAGAPSVPCHRGRDGHPVLLDAAVVRRVVDGPVPGGLRALLEDAARVEVDDPSVPLDFDDPASFAVAAELWDRRDG